MSIHVLWGSETGNAEGLAERCVERLQAASLAAESVDMVKVDAADLAQLKTVLIITSTWGDGDPPSNAINLHDQLCDMKKSVNLSHLDYSVLAIGDSSYPAFCQCGVDFDTHLERHGAKRLSPRIDCDLDFDEPFEQWVTQVISALHSRIGV